jgi:hypothetical protein
LFLPQKFPDFVQPVMIPVFGLTLSEPERVELLDTPERKVIDGVVPEGNVNVATPVRAEAVSSDVMLAPAASFETSL